MNSGTFTKTAGQIQSTLYEAGDKITYSCVGATVLSVDSNATKTCNPQNMLREWEPAGDVVCQGESANSFNGGCSSVSR